MSELPHTVIAVPSEPPPSWPAIEIPEPECHRCGSKTFVMFERLPWCKQHFLERVEEGETARQAGV
jgi:hypothetical protein